MNKMALVLPEKRELETNKTEAALEGAALEEYAAIAKIAGFSPSDLTAYQVRAHIRNSGLCIYDLKSVERFMDTKLGRPTAETYGGFSGNRIENTVTHHWGWHPLRKLDADRFQAREIGRNYIWSPDGKGLTLKFNQDNNDFYSRKDLYRTHTESRMVLREPYDRLIPFPVLKTIADIAVRFPSIGFIIADWAEYEVTTLKPTLMPQDPFLALIGDEIPVMVIERWDEPSFR